MKNNRLYARMRSGRSFFQETGQQGRSALHYVYVFFEHYMGLFLAITLLIKGINMPRISHKRVCYWAYTGTVHMLKRGFP